MIIDDMHKCVLARNVPTPLKNASNGQFVHW